MTDEYLSEIKNYCVGFIDLLGQRAALRGQGILPLLETQAAKNEFVRMVRDSIGAITELQRDADIFFDKERRGKIRQEHRERVPPDGLVWWDRMSGSRFAFQRWSDGLMLFAPLADECADYRMGDVLDLLLGAGSFCFWGLARGKPMRGGIDIGWGVELHQNELYGAAVARAYELESEVAQYPRIVIGKHVASFIIQNLKNEIADPIGENTRSLARISHDLLHQDIDGNYIVHYLGKRFQDIVTRTDHAYLYEKSLTFIREQLETHKESKSTTLALRYGQLLHYFEHFNPSQKD